MAYSHKIYLTKVVTQSRPSGDENVDTLVPYLSTIDTDIDRDPSTDPFHWNVCYSEDMQTATIGVYCDDTDHAILEADEDITLLS